MSMAVRFGGARKRVVRENCSQETCLGHLTAASRLDGLLCERGGAGVGEAAGREGGKEDFPPPPSLSLPLPFPPSS